MDSYLIFKTIHIVGVVIFVGNIAVTGWWKTMANRTSDPKIIAFAQRQVALTDYVFTAGGIVLLLIGGMGAAHAGNLPLAETPWIAHGGMLFVASGIVWFAILIPLQTKLARLSRDFAHRGAIPELLLAIGKIVGRLRRPRDSSTPGRDCRDGGERVG